MIAGSFTELSGVFQSPVPEHTLAAGISTFYREARQFEDSFKTTWMRNGRCSHEPKDFIKRHIATQ